MMDSFSFSGLVDIKSSFIFGGDIIHRAVWVMGFLVAIVQLSLTVIKSVKITGYIYIYMKYLFFSIDFMYVFWGFFHFLIYTRKQYLKSVLLLN